MKITLSKTIFVSGLILGGLASHAAADTPTEKVTFALSGYHLTSTKEQLVTLAGSEDALVQILTELRTVEQPPFVAVRAEKFLLKFAHRSDVSQTLSSDLRSTNYVGLARTIAAHIDEVPDETARRALARGVVERATTESTFVPYARSLGQSSDGEVQRIARGLQ